MHENNEFDQGGWLSQATGDSLRRQAAVWVWAIGSVQAVLFGCCGVSVAWMSIIPIEELQITDPAQFEVISKVYSMSGAVAAMIFFLGFAPAVAYLAMGFAVRAGRKLAIDASTLLAITQAIVFGLIFVVNVAAGLVQGSPAAITGTVLTFGTPLVLLVYGIRCLWRLRRFDHVDRDEQDTDPWNEPTG